MSLCVWGGGGGLHVQIAPGFIPYIIGQPHLAVLFYISQLVRFCAISNTISAAVHDVICFK